MDEPLNRRVTITYTTGNIDVGTIVEVDRTQYAQTHSYDNPWIIIKLENNWGRTIGTLNNLLANGWRFLDD